MDGRGGPFSCAGADAAVRQLAQRNARFASPTASHSGGLRADLVLVRGDPTTGIRDIRQIAAAWKRGAIVERRRSGRY